MRASEKRLIIFIAFTAIGFGAGFGQHESDPRTISFAQLTGSRFDTLVVARVGNITITAKEFLLSYEYGPGFVKRGKDSRQRHLEFMVNEKLLALDGYSRGLDTTRVVAHTVTEIEGDLATEELYKESVLSLVNVSDDEIAQGVVREKSNLTLKWLHGPSFDDIRKFQEQLEAGVSFDSLFVQQLSDSVVHEDRSMETTRFKLETKNPTLSAIVDTLRYGANSASIGTAQGWYIVRIASAWTNAITTESEHQRLTHNVKRALFKRKADAVSDQYVRDMMLDHNPTIKRQAFDILRAHIGKSFFPPEQVADWELTKKLMAEFGPTDSISIDDHLDEPLVSLVDREFKIQDFMAWYGAREATTNLRSTSRQRFFMALEQLIWRMVRDQLLVDRAKSRNLHQRDVVRTQKQWWQDKAVSALSKSHLAGQIRLSEKQLRKFYAQNDKEFTDKKQGKRSWEQVKKEVRQSVFASEWDKKLLHRVLALRQQYPVEIDHDILSELPIDIEAQPSAIDVYAAKQGGTFPRPAFPTIDYEWARWY